MTETTTRYRLVAVMIAWTVAAIVGLTVAVVAVGFLGLWVAVGAIGGIGTTIVTGWLGQVIFATDHNAMLEARRAAEASRDISS